MRLLKNCIVLFCVLLLSGHAYVYGSQNPNLDQTDRLAALAKVWGLLKYYHPDVATGEIDWDAVLITTIPLVKAAGDYDSFNQEIANLIGEAGGVDKFEFNPQTPAHPNEKLFKWIKDHRVFNNEVRKMLKTVQKKHVPAENHYVQYDNYGTAFFGNEDPYDQTIYPDENYRLLSLFRQWNIVNYFFPYRDVMDRDMDDVLTELIPIYIAAGDKCEYSSALSKFQVMLNDAHAIRRSPNGLGCSAVSMYVPFDVALVEGKTVVERTYPNLLSDPDAVKIGDVILKREGQDIDEYRAERYPITIGSNDASIQRYINWSVVRGPAPQLTYTIEKNGQVSDVTFETHTVLAVYLEQLAQDRLKDPWKILPGNIGYVNMGIVYPEDVEQVMADFWDTKAIIFDLRFHARGTAYYFPDYLFPEITEVAKFTRPDLDYPGDFFEYPLSLGPSTPNPDYYKGKVVIIVNYNAISHSEYTAMILQGAPDATTIGNQTCGADGNATYYMLPGGFTLYMSGLGVYYPDGTATQRVGVAIDIEAHPTVDGLREGRDELVETAVQYIENSKK